MSDILLAKPILPPDWIDVSVGEPHLVRDNLIKVFQLEEELKIGHLKADSLVYPAPTGYQPLVRHLEEKHKAPVIITNGAKQALGAVFYALKKMGWNYCGEKSPHWALVPPLAEMHGIEMIHANGPHVDDGSPFLLLSPNNPDGHCETPEQLQELSKQFKEKNLPLIHDAAYYTHIYLDSTHTLPAIGDVQIYSISKMLGLSGLRIGYAVCPNPQFYKLMQQYIEAMTVGVSISSQTWLYDLLDRRMRSFPTLVERFEGISGMDLARNKQLCLGIDPEVLEVPANLAKNPGMFGWFKVGPQANFSKSKINFIDGALFGVPGMVRMNLAFDEATMKEIVNRLNSSKGT
jgi:aspartate/methionine/tyrosine aminotransferase